MNFMEFAKYKTRSNFPTIGNVQRLYLSMDDNKLYHYDHGKYSLVSANAFEEDTSPATIVVDALIEDIEDGTIVAGKAVSDGEGNPILYTYAANMDALYKDTDNQVWIELQNKDGNPLADKTITLPKATTSKDGLMAKEDKVYVDGLPSALALKENKSEKGIANGYASLDSGAKIHSSQLPDSILGQLEYKGTFNPSSGYPASPELGWFYIAIANATISGVDYKVGDWAVYNGSSWDKVDNTDAVASVNGKLGVVVLYGNEIEVGNGDTWTVEQRIVDLYTELNDRYTKGEVDTELVDKADATHTHTKSQITDFPTTMTPTAHNHDSDYYKKTEIDTMIGDIDSVLDSILGV